jgi:restriction endonuclease S subunit
LDRIQQKIAAVLQKKDALIQQLEAEHKDVLADIEYNEEQLDAMRQEAYA